MKNVDKTMLKKISSQLEISEAELLERVSFLFKDNRPTPQKIHLLEDDQVREVNVNCTGIGTIVNEYGTFLQYSFRLDDQWIDYSVLVKAKRFDKYRLPIFELQDYFLVRFDSHCETQMLFGDQTCDCLGQLNLAMEEIEKRGEGAIIHIKRHEGRGKGIASKLDQLSICSVLGIDTVNASLLRAELIEGIPTKDFHPVSVIDTRTFLGCVAIMKYFNVPKKIKLLIQTNNPNKLKEMRANGYECEFYQIHTEPNEFNKHHLEAKKSELSHKL